MKILKIIVDEIPKSCWYCPYALMDDDTVFYCSALPVSPLDNALNEHNLYVAKPDWCPLVTEKTDEEFFYKYREEFMESEDKQDEKRGMPWIGWVRE